MRSAAVGSMCQLACGSPVFARLCIDFLVDMFSDEIEEVRLKAISALKTMSTHIIFREDQLQIILALVEVTQTKITYISLKISKVLHYFVYFE